MGPKQYCVYILASRMGGTLYTGMSSRLLQRVWEHKNHVVRGFTDRYDVTQLVWYEVHDDPVAALTREKQIKEWKRAWKIALIEKANPYWHDLYDDLSP